MIPSSLNAADFKNVREKYCFYLDLKDRGLSKSISNRIQDLGLREEVFLTECVTHVVRVGGGGGGGCSGAGAPPCAVSTGRRTRADAMLQRLHPAGVPSQLTLHRYDTLSVREAILLLDQIYDKYFKFASRKNSQFIVFNKDFIKVEILDRLCRPFYEEFDKWPELTVEPLRLRKQTNNNSPVEPTKMTRRSRPRVREPEDDPKPGFCEICTADYLDVTEHQQSPHHLKFAQNDKNFFALDNLIKDGNDIASFIEKSTPVNGERRSQRKLCNGDAESPKKRSTRSKTPEPVTNEPSESSSRSKRHDDGRRRHSRRKRKSKDKPIEEPVEEPAEELVEEPAEEPVEEPAEESNDYYRVVNTAKLRSSGGFTKKKDETGPSDEQKPLVVMFRKIRKSEISLLNDEAEQFMFPPKRSTSTSSELSDDGKKDDKASTSRPLNLERRRQARPLDFKEESSEDDSWPPKPQKRKRRASAKSKRTKPVTRSAGIKLELPEPEPDLELDFEPELELEPEPIAAPPRSPSPPPRPPRRVADVPLPVWADDNPDRCIKWENGKLKCAETVDELKFAFESVPACEPWFSAFSRQDNNVSIARNVPDAFSLYSKSPKLPYEIGNLPPLQPHPCMLTQIPIPGVKGRAYGTRRQNNTKPAKKRLVSTFLANETHARKSPREHASTLAMLGAVGNRRLDDNKSTASEDTVNDLPLSEIQQSEKLTNLLETVFDDAGEFEMQESMMEPDVGMVSSSAQPDVLNLVEMCEDNDLIKMQLQLSAAEELLKLQREQEELQREQEKLQRAQEELRQLTEIKKPAKGRKNKTGWPRKRRGGGRKKKKVPKIKQEVVSAAEEEEIPNGDLNGADFMAPAEYQAGEFGNEEVQLDVQLLVQSPRCRERRDRSAWLQPVVRVDRVQLPLRRSSRNRTQTTLR